MSWVVIGIVLFFTWLAFRAVGMVIRLVLWAVVIAAAYWLLASLLGWPLPF